MSACLHVCVHVFTRGCIHVVYTRVLCVHCMCIHERMYIYACVDCVCSCFLHACVPVCARVCVCACPRRQVEEFLAVTTHSAAFF